MLTKPWPIIIFISTCLVLLVQAPPSTAAKLVLIEGAGRSIPAVVQEIVDSQTLLLRMPDGKMVCFVLNGINTPLKHQPGYRRSVLGLIDLSQGRLRSKVRVQLDAVIYDTIWLGVMYDLSEENNANLALIRSGYAWPDVYHHDHNDQVNIYRQNAAEALHEARSNARGHWLGIHIGEAPEAPAQSYISHLIRNGHAAAVCQPSSLKN